MKYTLYWEPKSQIFDTHPQNKGVRDVLKRVAEFRKAGIPLELKDTGQMTTEEFTHAYTEAIIPSVYKKYRVRRIFGTNRRSSAFFGRQIPALLVRDETDEEPGDIYPHEQSDGRIVTIHDFLTKLMTTRAKARS